MYTAISGLGALLLLILISAIPVIAIYFWFRISRYPFPLARFLIVLLVGAAAFFPALLMQYFFPVLSLSGKLALLTRIFSRVAFTEELSRLIVLTVLFWISRRLTAASSGVANSSTDLRSPVKVSFGEATQGSAIGIVAGLGFAVLENTVYGAANPSVMLLRVFTASPLHAACGSRVGAAAMLIRAYPAHAVFRFLSAVFIHGTYNFLIESPGFPAIVAVFIALSALVSSLMTIYTEKTKNAQT